MANDDDYEEEIGSERPGDSEIISDANSLENSRPSMYETYDHFDKGLQDYPFEESSIDKGDFLDYYQTLTSSHLQNLLQQNPDTAVQNLINIYKSRKDFVEKRDSQLKHSKIVDAALEEKARSKGEERVLGVRQQIVNANYQKLALERELREIHKDKEELEKLGQLDDEALENYAIAVNAKTRGIQEIKVQLDGLNKQFYRSFEDDQTQSEAG